MRKFIKYLIVTIFAFAFIGSTEQSNSICEENPIRDLTAESVTIHTNFSVFDSALYATQQISLVNPTSLQRPLQRVNKGQKQNYIFIKAGKILNTGVINSIQNNSQIFYSSLIKPVRRLISFGKLII